MMRGHQLLSRKSLRKEKRIFPASLCVLKEDELNWLGCVNPGVPKGMKDGFFRNNIHSMKEINGKFWLRYIIGKESPFCKQRIQL